MPRQLAPEEHVVSVRSRPSMPRSLLSLLLLAALLFWAA